MASASTAFVRFSAGAALVAWFAVSLELYVVLSGHWASGKSLWLGLVHYLGFFTVLTNILCALVLSAHALPLKSHPALNFLRTSAAITTATVSILGVAAGYHLLLRNLWQPAGLQALASVLLHYVVPALFSVFWWRTLPWTLPAWSDLPKICSYPIGYGFYVLIRGEWLAQYPYPFFDVGKIGYLAASVNAVAIFAAFVVMAAVLIAVNRRFASGLVRNA